MNIRIVVLVLAVMAFAQGGLVAYWMLQRPSGQLVSTPVGPKTDTAQTEQSRSATPPASSPRARLRFDWASVEHTDFEQYIANLRAIGCPEETIRDIIIADVNKLYAPREAAFRVSSTTPPRAKGLLPWETQAAPTVAAQAVDAKADFERRRQLREVEREKAAVIKQLLGIELPLSPLRSWRSRNYDRIESALAALPASQRERVREIQEVYWQASDTLNDQSKERGPDFQSEYRRINEERRSMLAQVLTPEEMEDFEMRSSSGAQQLSSQLSGFKPTEQEFRALYAMRREQDEANQSQASTTAEDQGKLSVQERLQREQANLNRIRETLGEERFAEYRKATDPAWQELSKLQSRFEIEPEKINEAYGIVTDLQKRAEETLTANAAAFSGGRPSKDNPEIQEIQSQFQQTLESMKSILGDKAGLVLQARAGNMTPRVFGNFPANPERRAVERVISEPNPQP